MRVLRMQVGQCKHEGQWTYRWQHTRGAVHAWAAACMGSSMHWRPATGMRGKHTPSICAPEMQSSSLYYSTVNFPGLAVQAREFVSMDELFGLG